MSFRMQGRPDVKERDDPCSFATRLTIVPIRIEYPPCHAWPVPAPGTQQGRYFCRLQFSGYLVS